MKVKSCCFCLSVEMGVMVIGCLCWASLLNEFNFFNPIRACITVATGIQFFLMVFQDSQENRKRFFFAYAIFCLSSLIFGVHQAYTQLEDHQAVEL